MDADDESLPHRLERQTAFLREHPEVDILGTAAILAGDERVVVRPLTHEAMVARIFQENPLIHPSVMMRRHVLNALGGYDESLRRAQDYDLWFRAIERFRCHNLEEPLIRYRLPKHATLRSSSAAARVAWMNGRRRHMPLRAALFAIRYVAGFVIARLRGHL
jgi:hypothetical protein